LKFLHADTPLKVPYYISEHKEESVTVIERCTRQCIVWTADSATMEWNFFLLSWTNYSPSFHTGIGTGTDSGSQVATTFTALLI
jgi:hypothetical protein